mmetsp:Transcript_20811/g.38182  ORF Transcript_20811/g.38182 Transcript_20811/m.38182 type:complete len:103 (+) Transcript_20811:664-972(+)
MPFAKYSYSHGKVTTIFNTTCLLCSSTMNMTEPTPLIYISASFLFAQLYVTPVFLTKSTFAWVAFVSNVGASFVTTNVALLRVQFAAPLLVGNVGTSLVFAY